MKDRFYGSYGAYALCFFCLYFANGIVCNILSVYLLGQGQSALATSLIVTAGSVFSILLQPCLGACNDKLGRPGTVISLTLLASAGFCLCFGVSRSVWLLFLFNGLMLSLCDSVCLLFEQLAAKTPYPYGPVRIWGTAGYALAAQAAGLAYEKIAPGSVFWIYAAGMLLTVLALRQVPLQVLSAPGETQAEPPAARQKGGLGALLKPGPFLLFLLLCLLFRGILTVSTTYLQPLLMAHGLSVSASGTVVFVATLTEGPLLLLSGRFMDRLRCRPALAASFAALAVLLLCLGRCPALPPVIAAAILRPLVGMLFNMLVLKITLLLAPAALTGTAIGLTGAAKCLGAVLFQSLGGGLMDAMGIGALFGFLAALAGAGLVLSLFCKVQDRPGQAVFSKG